MSYQTYNQLGKSQSQNSQQMLQASQRTQHTQPTQPIQGPEAPSINSIEEKKKQIWTHEICIFKISAKWCKPCLVISPLYDQLAASLNKPSSKTMITKKIFFHNSCFFFILLK